MWKCEVAGAVVEVEVNEEAVVEAFTEVNAAVRDCEDGEARGVLEAVGPS